MSKIGIAILVLVLLSIVAFVNAAPWIGGTFAWAAVITVILGVLSLNKTSD